MMTLDELKRHLDPFIDDVDAALVDFRESTPGEVQPYAFLEWLRDRGDLSSAEMLAVHASEPIATTPLGDDQELETLAHLGAGGVGEVFVARDPRLNRKVALKVMRRPDPRKQAKRMRRFVNEAQITAQLGHPGIVPIYDLRVHEDGTLAYSMKLVHGKTLSEVVAADREKAERDGARHERRALPRRLEHFVKVCDAMGSAHQHRVIHRDLKPDNVMVGPFNEVYVMDWGLAKVLGDEPSPPKAAAVKAPAAGRDLPKFGRDLPKFGRDEDLDPHALTRPGQLIGTPRYMSAEQARGKVRLLDARSDVASLGAILYELVTLRTARDTDDFGELLRMVTEGSLGPTDHAIDGIVVAPELCAIALKACHGDPAERYASADELGEDVRRFLRGERVRALPDSRRRRWQRWIARNGQTLFTMLVAALVAVVVLLVALVLSLV